MLFFVARAARLVRVGGARVVRAHVHARHVVGVPPLDVRADRCGAFEEERNWRIARKLTGADDVGPEIVLGLGAERDGLFLFGLGISAIGEAVAVATERLAEGREL